MSDILRGARDALGFVAAVVILMVLVHWYSTGAFLFGPKPFDPTDAPPNRSGMSLHTDAQTGCQYLGGKSGGLTPRLAPNGKHMGCKP